MQMGCRTPVQQQQQKMSTKSATDHSLKGLLEGDWRLACSSSTVLYVGVQKEHFSYSRLKLTASWSGDQKRRAALWQIHQHPS
jgi:hypothetical protein